MQAPAPKHMPVELGSSSASSSDEEPQDKSQLAVDKIKAKALRRRTSQSAKEKLDDKGKASTAPVPGTDDVLEVWFSGCHEGA